MTGAHFSSPSSVGRRAGRLGDRAENSAHTNAIPCQRPRERESSCAPCWPVIFQFPLSVCVCAGWYVVVKDGRSWSIKGVSPFCLPERARSCAPRWCKLSSYASSCFHAHSMRIACSFVIQQTSVKWGGRKGNNIIISASARMCNLAALSQYALYALRDEPFEQKHFSSLFRAFSHAEEENNTVPSYTGTTKSSRCDFLSFRPF